MMFVVLKVRGHLVADLDPIQIKFGNGTLFYNRHGQPDPSVVRDYLIRIESKTKKNIYSLTHTLQESMFSSQWKLFSSQSRSKQTLRKRNEQINK